MFRGQAVAASLLLGLLAPGAVGQIEGAAVDSVSAGMSYLVGSVDLTEAREAAEEEDDDAVSRGDDTADDDAVFRGMGSMGSTWDGDGTNPSMLLLELAAGGGCAALARPGRLSQHRVSTVSNHGHVSERQKHPVNPWASCIFKNMLSDSATSDSVQ